MIVGLYTYKPAFYFLCWDHTLRLSTKQLISITSENLVKVISDFGWYDFKEYNPFKLRRSVGLGMRFFLPMFGLLGFLPGWIIASILNSAGKLRIPREAELAGLDYNLIEASKRDQDSHAAAEQ